MGEAARGRDTGSVSQLIDAAGAFRSMLEASSHVCKAALLQAPLSLPWCLLLRKGCFVDALPVLDLSNLRDLQNLMASSGDNLAERLITLFLTSSPTVLQDLRIAQTSTDLNRLSIGLSRLQGSSAVLGGLQVAAYCTQIEMIMMLDAGRLSDLEPILTKLEDVYAALAAALEAYRQNATQAFARGSSICG
jgi:HPt (histidine-containing phosphotransfer) domain-containing protein